ncbi:MAG TPA: RICIN domain-containing protein [Anaerolineales bacterium]|nr:RICIN domain-containing protein [Anaerolineales bacterium]
MGDEIKNVDSMREDEGPLLRPRFVPEKPEKIIIDPAYSIAGLFIIKFIEGSHIRLGSKGLLVDAKAILSNSGEQQRLARVGLDSDMVIEELEDVSQVLYTFRDSHGFELNYIFRPVDFLYLVDDTKADIPFREKDELEQRVGEELADLDLYYVAFAKEFKDMPVQQDFMNQLNGFRIVEQVYAAVPTDGAQDPTPDISGQQGYFGPAPMGLDAFYAWTQPGGRGDGVRLIDVEYDWVTDHEDFPPASQMFWGGRPSCPYDGNGSEHGTAVMGIIAAPANNFGINGFASNVQYGLCSVCRPFDVFWAALVTTFSGEDLAARGHNVVVANSINLAAGGLRPGDLLLIEQHSYGPVGGQWVAMEYYQECFDVIRRTTARGIIVVEAAGNGAQNLDTAPYGRRFAPSIRYSGALLVGASGQGDNIPSSVSNSSQRIDVHAWGEGVVATGYGRGDGTPFEHTRPINRFYRSDFSGTSSASAIIAGAVASLQGIRRATGQPPLTPVQLANILSATGSPQRGTALEIEARPIGKQPNLRAAIPRAISSDGFNGPGIYFIRSKWSGKVLDIDISWFRGQDNGQPLVQQDFHGGLNQQFEVVSAGPGPFWIFPRHTRRKVLDVAGVSAADGAGLQQWSLVNGANQRFLIEPWNGYYRIMATHDGKVLDVTAFSRDNGARIQQWTWLEGDNQLFEFNRVR